jgi:hypothetical protein
VLDELQATIATSEQLAEPVLALNERPLAEVVSVKLQEIEDEKHRRRIMRPAMQGLEVAHAIAGEPHHLTVEGDGLHPHGAHDARVALRPIVTAARAQGHVLADTAGDQAIAVVLDLVHPSLAAWRRDGSGRKARCEGR